MDDNNAILLEETRGSFFRIESWVASLDLKSSIIIAIDAILLSSLELTTHFSQQNSILRFLITLPILLSITLAFCCLWPREWDGPHGLSIINKCSSQESAYTASVLARTYADWEDKLFEVYKNKFSCFENSVVFTMISMEILFAFFIGFIFSS